MTQPICNKWNEFEGNIINSFKELRSDSDFYDVTLVCEEDQRIEAHRIILTACIPVFGSLLKSSKHSHPMIYMRGVEARNLVAIVNFIYHGEANIYQEDIDGFLVLGNDLKLRGLFGSEVNKEIPIHQEEKQGIESVP